MLVENGKYFAIPVERCGPEFELEVESDSDMHVITGQRVSVMDSESANGIDVLKGQVKDKIEEVKKGGWKSALSLAKKAASEYMMDDREKQARRDAENYKDPLKPENAFAFPDGSYVKYEAIDSLRNREKITESYQFRTDRSYGILTPLGDGVLREVSFTYPSHEYAEKYYPEQHVGHNVADWRREDEVLHRMRVHYLSKDKSKAESIARAKTLSEEENEYFTIDMSSTPSGEKTRFSAPNLKIDPNTGDLNLGFLNAWFLPEKTLSGRQVQYNWDALRISVTQGDQLIRRKVCWSSNRGREYIKPLDNKMEVMDDGYLGEYREGKYELRVSAYHQELMVYPFEVKRIDSTDVRSDPATYYVLSTPKDDFAEFRYNQGGIYALDINYPYRTLAERYGSEEKITVECEIIKDGTAWLPYELSECEADTMHLDIEIRNEASWTLLERTLSVPLGTPPPKRSKNRDYTPPPAGKYSLLVLVNGNEESRIDFEIDGEGDTLISDEATYPDLPLANFEFAEEHHTQLFRITRL